MCALSPSRRQSRPSLSLVADRIIYFTAAFAGLMSCFFVYLASVALNQGFVTEERSAERKDENGGTTLVDLGGIERRDSTGSL